MRGTQCRLIPPDASSTSRGVRHARKPLLDRSTDRLAFTRVANVAFVKSQSRWTNVFRRGFDDAEAARVRGRGAHGDHGILWRDFLGDRELDSGGFVAAKPRCDAISAG